MNWLSIFCVCVLGRERRSTEDTENQNKKLIFILIIKGKVQVCPAWNMSWYCGCHGTAFLTCDVSSSHLHCCMENGGWPVHRSLPFFCGASLSSGCDKSKTFKYNIASPTMEMWAFAESVQTEDWRLSLWLSGESAEQWRSGIFQQGRVERSRRVQGDS